MSDKLELWRAKKKELGLKNKDIAEIANLPLRTVEQVMCGTVKSPRLDTVQAIERALGIENSIFSNYLSRFDNLSPISTQKVPMLGDIACGKPIWANEERESYVQIGKEIQADFCLTARGDSMIGARIHDGDIVFCRAQETVENGEVAAVIIGDEATLKRVYYYPEKKKLVLQAENPKYEPFVYIGEELSEIRIIGKAVAFQSDVQ